MYVNELDKISPLSSFCPSFDLPSPLFLPLLFLCLPPGLRLVPVWSECQHQRDQQEPPVPMPTQHRPRPPPPAFSWQPMGRCVTPWTRLWHSELSLHIWRCSSSALWCFGRAIYELARMGIFYYSKTKRRNIKEINGKSGSQTIRKQIIKMESISCLNIGHCRLLGI